MRTILASVVVLAMALMTASVVEAAGHSGKHVAKSKPVKVAPKHGHKNGKHHKHPKRHGAKGGLLPLVTDGLLQPPVAPDAAPGDDPTVVPDGTPSKIPVTPADDDDDDEDDGQ